MIAELKRRGREASTASEIAAAVRVGVQYVTVILGRLEAELVVAKVGKRAGVTRAQSLFVLKVFAPPLSATKAGVPERRRAPADVGAGGVAGPCLARGYKW